MRSIMRKFKNNSLAREISAVLLIKICLIFGLWYAFFSHPVDRHLTDRGVSAVILGQDVRETPPR
jgi:hypothetical protein